MSLIAQGWRRVARIAGIAWVAWAVALTILAGELIPPVVIVAAVMMLAWLATEWKPNRISLTVFGVLSLVVIVLNAPFIAGDLAHPESAWGFNTTTLPVLLAAAGILVGLSVWWGALTERASARALVVLGGVFVAGLALSVVAAMGVESDTAQAGDLGIVAKRADYTPEALTASAGTVAIFVENQDSFRHTFAIAALDLEIEVPGNTDRRIEVALHPGTYDFLCTVPGHDSMTGTITVG